MTILTEERLINLALEKGLEYQTKKEVQTVIEVIDYQVTAIAGAAIPENYYAAIDKLKAYKLTLTN